MTRRPAVLVGTLVAVLLVAGVLAAKASGVAEKGSGDVETQSEAALALADAEAQVAADAEAAAQMAAALREAAATSTTTTVPPTTTTTAPPPPPPPPTTTPPTTTPPAPPPPPPPPAPAPAGVVEQLLALHNAERDAAGLPRFTLSTCISNVARPWSQRLASTGELAHNNLTPVMQCHGSNGAGENVGEHRSMAAIHDMWMASAGHRANILNPSYRRIGIGVTQDSSGRYWAVVDFAT